MTNSLDALGDQELRRMLGYVRRSPRPVTAVEAADALLAPRTVARSRLERLARAGLVVTGFERRTGRTGPGAGRPAKTYAAAPETAHVEYPRRRYERLIALLASQLRGRSKLEEVGRAFGRELAEAARVRPARRPATALERLCAGLGTLGFHATVASISRGEAVIETATCPLRPLVVDDGTGQALDRAMWTGLVGAALDGAVAGCETSGCLDAGGPCRVRVTFAG
jgi:predicted ArsR family transcriptional regulator